ncbi:hypothetical protein [Clostridium beijerinckii]|uniref:Uncharacterized protein n=1 Tax=Clostridium beijerinckii TaxID=1520 RepID=A0AAX0B0W7_CLOBE|nr:hypothetical protein [Clostridium beijerinckii]NRT88965.1 hypothetical protein [Clostridium beijerinckii]NYC74420.1 hypothetical protein [Clostridium beijerinckii]
MDTALENILKHQALRNPELLKDIANDLREEARRLDAKAENLSIESNYSCTVVDHFCTTLGII